MSNLRVVFMGTPEFACPTLQKLIDRGDNIVAVVTQPDRPKGRGQQVTAPPVKILAAKYDIPVYQPHKVRESAFVDQLKEMNPDLIIVVAFGQILPKAVLEIPRHGCINVHASLLPRYRGAAPINWCIINGEAETGVTTMMMDVGLDTGDMLVKKAIRIDSNDDARILHDKLSVLGAEALAETLDLLDSGSLFQEKQDDSLTCYAPMLKKEDGAINWEADSLSLRNRIRGMNPWPGTYTFLEGKMLKVFRAIEGDGHGAPGTVLQVGRDGVEVACGDNSVVITELQIEGKKRLPVAEFLAGCRIEVGTVLGRFSP